MMRYPILIEQGTERAAFGVVVPDLPGCFSAGDTLDEALDATKEAVAAWVDAALDGGRHLPAAAPASEDADYLHYVTMQPPSVFKSRQDAATLMPVRGRMDRLYGKWLLTGERPVTLAGSQEQLFCACSWRDGGVENDHTSLLLADS
jgi:predicted RNase H-like HicB family nuclease